METIIELHRDLQKYPDKSIRLMATHFDLTGSVSDLRWLLAINNSTKKAQMNPVLTQLPVLESMAKNMSVPEVLNYANVNRLSKNSRNFMLENAKVSKADIQHYFELGLGDLQIQISLFKNPEVKRIDSPYFFQNLIGSRMVNTATDLLNSGKYDIDNIGSLHLKNVNDAGIALLSNFNNLCELYIRDSTITNFLPLQNLQLTDLIIKNSRISGFTGLSRVSTLKLDNCIVNFDITGLSRLDSLHLYNTDISDLTPLPTGLRGLEIFNAPSLSNLTPLASQTQLRELYLMDVPNVTSLSVIAHLPIERLLLFNTGVGNSIVNVLNVYNSIKIYLGSNRRLTDLRELNPDIIESSLILNSAQYENLIPESQTEINDILNNVEYYIEYIIDEDYKQVYM